MSRESTYWLCEVEELSASGRAGNVSGDGTKRPPKGSCKSRQELGRDGLTGVNGCPKNGIVSQAKGFRNPLS